ncbi:MAG TPA: L-seryl-tRNA(Sec) selenium transferase, partial [candidate division Zixibacteria bacterium]|nr:L-seryl-tRNA(Sec) selenium transferase [candidate division Zixibacteria bacterium]
MNKVIKQLRDFPSIEELLQHKKISEALAPIPRPLAVILVRESVAAAKKTFSSGKEEVSLQKLVNRIIGDIETHRRRRIGRVINATGVVVHTNL